MVNLSLDDTKKLQNATEAAIAEGGMRPHDAEKRRLAAVVEHLAGLIQRDRDAELRLLKEESDVIAAECKAGKRPRFTFLPTPQEVLAKRLYDKWIAAGELLPGEGAALTDIVESRRKALETVELEQRP